MKKFLEEVGRRIREVKLSEETLSPQTKMDRTKGEKTLGILSRDLQKFWIVLEQLTAEYDQEQKAIIAIDDDVTKICISQEMPDVAARIVLHDLTYRRVEYVKQQFWRLVREEFVGGDPNAHIALRDGWVVVLCHRQVGDFLIKDP